MTVITLREGAPSTVLRMEEALAAKIQELKIATVTPAGHGDWTLSNIARVGVVRVLDTTLRIEPKVPIARLFYLLSRSAGWNEWRDDRVHLESIDDLYPAIVGLFSRMAEDQLRRGVLRSYRTERRSEPYVRGRWLVGEQIRLRQGLPLPAELEIDEYSDDIAENRLLKSAARKALRAPFLSSSARRELHLIDHHLAEVHVLTRGVPLPSVRIDRLNSRFASALALARLILEDASLDHDPSDVAASGFLLTMASVFERFVQAEVSLAAQRVGGRIVPQHRSHLDRDLLVEVKPDLVWLDGLTVRAIFDAKYKAEKPAGYPNADVYQMLAYCLRHGVDSGHLIYAAGNETPARYVIETAGVTVVCHALDLDTSPPDLSAQIGRIVEEAGLRRNVLVG